MSEFFLELFSEEIPPNLQKNVRRNQVDKAINAFQESLVLNPQSAKTYYNLGLLFMRKGNTVSANYHFEEASKLGLKFDNASSQAYSEFKNELEKRFKVSITKVSTMNFNGKSKNSTIRSGGHVLRSSGKRSNWKKAVVTLKDGDKINLVDGDFS